MLSGIDLTRTFPFVVCVLHERMEEMIRKPHCGYGLPLGAFSALSR
ncbi:hypothetical protein KSAC_32120 (plasmid) [Komagataeibacter saccharivorans]|nr:hypothetical protein KSAC_32120 [Komagataeibacter saccharivorans]